MVVFIVVFGEFVRRVCNKGPDLQFDISALFMQGTLRSGPATCTYCAGFLFSRTVLYSRRPTLYCAYTRAE